VETQFGGIGPRRHEVRPAERGQEVVESNFVGDIDGCQAKAPLVLVAAKEIVVSYREIEQVSRRDPRWIFVIILCSRSRNRDSGGTVL